MINNVIDIRTKMPRDIPYDDLAKAVAQSIEELRPLRKDQTRLDEALNILKEIRFCAHFNPTFREETKEQLMNLLDLLYEEVNT